MTLPIPAPCADNAPLTLRVPPTTRRKPCLSAAWADPPPPTTRREHRRAICSWSVGYGTLKETLNELEDSDPHQQQHQQRKVYGTLNELEEVYPHHYHHQQPYKVADNSSAGLLGNAHASAAHTGATPRTRNFLGLGLGLGMPGLKSLVSRRRNSSNNALLQPGGSLRKCETVLAGVLRSSNSSSSLEQSKRAVNKCETVLTGVLRASNSSSSLEQSKRAVNKCETVLAGVLRSSSSSSSLEQPIHAAVSRRKCVLTDVLRSSSSSSGLDQGKRAVNKCVLGGVLRSSSSSSSLEKPIQAVNRFRGSHSRVCSRCSSLLTLASASRYSLDASTGGFVQLKDEPQLLCKLCLVEVEEKDACHIQQCDCSFCIECMKSYVVFEIAEGAYDISCPDAQCPAQGVLQQEEIKRLAGNDLLEKHLKYRLNREVEIDKTRMWCPRAGCETVCSLCPALRCHPQSVHCPSCTVNFCSSCKLEWHQGLTCEENNKRLAKQGRAEEAGIPFDSDLIKCCPMCNVPIEKDEGCAQMMCKRCKHVFCWYCLANLDDDFLLRHYDKGPCKNKLGHSRASVIWHRTQVIGIFAGFGILLLVASPLLLLAAPCIVCCKCRVCNGWATKVENEDDLPEENITLQR